MTKQQELDALKKFTESIPQDSYLRPWLEEVFLSVHEDIKNDFPLSPTIKDTRERCGQLLLKAEGEAQGIITQAERAAEKLYAEAKRKSESVHGQILAVLSACN